MVGRNSRRTLSAFLLAAAVALGVAAPSHAAEKWLAPKQPSVAGKDADSPDAPRGAAAPPPPAERGPPRRRPPVGAKTAAPAVAASAPAGNAMVVWRESDGANNRIRAAYRGAGGSFEAPRFLSPAGVEAAEP